MDRFAELCRKLGGEFLREESTLKCIIERPAWVPSLHELRMVTDMIADARLSGKNAVVSFGNRLLGGWWEGVSISLVGDAVVVSGNVYSEVGIDPRFVEDVIDAVIEKETRRNGTEMRIEAYVDENPATNEYVGVAHVATEEINVNELSPERLSDLVSAVIGEADKYAHLALEKMVITREEILL